MKNIENIRNVTIIAHIDHGKTTLSDSLLAASGLISKKLASELRYLDYDQIEQTRGITIKAANAVIHYIYKGQEYIINLIDTPGHIDFSGYVTRSLRASDGALVVIDAIEGVMVQTETVTRQALSEYVKPVLFINKVDRLIKEKRLNPDDFLKAINDIVRNFNILLEKYSESKISENWRVSFLRLNVAFGSAKDKWGVRLIDILEWAGKSINDVKSTSELLQILKDFLKYVYSQYKENNVKELSERFPVGKAVLEMIIDHIPNPREAQKARIPIIWQGDLSSEIGKALIECDLNAPPVVFIYDVKYDLKAGFIATGRVFSGTIKVKQALHMVHAGNDFIVNQLAVVIGKSKIPVREVSSGNHVVFIGIKDIIVGETIVSPELKNIEPFERLRYVSEPVVTVSIEPVDFSQYDYVQQMISQFAKTEPGIEFSINKDKHLSISSTFRIGCVGLSCKIISKSSLLFFLNQSIFLFIY
ncbi:MAG: GTP-binding protein [Candidatus Asgardarchaeia archaeon]